MQRTTTTTTTTRGKGGVDMEEEDKEIMEIIYKKLCVNVAWFIWSVLAGMLLLIVILIILMIMGKFHIFKRLP